MSNYQIPDFVSDCTYESSRQTGYAPPRLNPKNPDIIQHSVKLNWVETCFLRRNIHSIANACQDPNLSAQVPPLKYKPKNIILIALFVWQMLRPHQKYITKFKVSQPHEV